MRSSLGTARASVSVRSTWMPLRCVHSTDPQETSLHPPMPLRKAAWCNMDPVEKWTSLIDIGRQVPEFVWPTNQEDKPTAPRRVFLRLAGSFVRRWGLATRQETGSGGQCSVRAADAQRHLHVSYAMRLRIGLSLLMWLRCLKDVQDTMARLKLPYARTTRRVVVEISSTSAAGSAPASVRRSVLVAHVFPTRNAERFVDATTSLELWLGDPKAACVAEGGQIPAPHTWNPETVDILDDEEEGASILTPHQRHRRGKRESKAERFRRVCGVEYRRGADDEKAHRCAPSEVAMRRRRGRASSNTTLRVDGGESTMSDTSRFTSPLDPHPEKDAAFHANDGRRDGCPLGADGELHGCPIHVYLPPVSADSTSPLNNPTDTMHLFVSVHAAILSCLYIQGRVATVFTDSEAIGAYVKSVFQPVVQLGSLRVVLQPRPAEDMFMPYIPRWSEQHAWVVGFDVLGIPLHLKDDTTRQWGTEVVQRLLLSQGGGGAEHIGGGGSRQVVIVPTPAEKEVLEDALQEHGIAGSWDVFAVEQHTGSMLTLRDTLQHVACVSLVTTLHPSAPLLASWIDRNIPEHVHRVAINAHTRDMLWFYPHAALLPRKVGNAFRFVAVQRNILARPYRRRVWLPSLHCMSRKWLGCAPPKANTAGARRCGGCTSDFSPSDVARWADEVRRRSTTAPPNVEVLHGNEESAEDALVLERTIEHLSNPSKWSMLALLSAKWLNI